MSIADFANVSQIAASFAVVLSLIYLALQVRQAERNQRAIIQQGRANRTSQASIDVAGSGLATVFRRGVAGDPDLTPEQFDQWMLICRALWLSSEDSFLQHEAGLLDEHAFQSYVAGVRHYISSPGMRAAWRIGGAQFGANFRAFIDRTLASTPLAPPRDAYATWQEVLKQEHAAQAQAATSAPATS